MTAGMVFRDCGYMCLHNNERLATNETTSCSNLQVWVSSTEVLRKISFRITNEVGINHVSYHIIYDISSKPLTVY